MLGYKDLKGKSKVTVRKKKIIEDEVVVQTMRYMELLKELKKSGNKKQKVL